MDSVNFAEVDSDTNGFTLIWNVAIFHISLIFWRGLHLSLTPGVFLQRLDGEACEAFGTFQTHFHWLVVLHRCADVVVAVGDWHQGADIYSSVMFVEEKSDHVAVRADGFQLLLVFHCLWEEKINIRRLNSHEE